MFNDVRALIHKKIQISKVVYHFKPLLVLYSVCESSKKSLVNEERENMSHRD